MHEARLRPHMLGEGGKEGDDVVPRLALDLVDARHVETAPLPDGLAPLLGDEPELGHRIASMRLDLEPDAEPVLRLPDADHFWAAVARDHGRPWRLFGRSGGGLYGGGIAQPGRNSHPGRRGDRLASPRRSGENPKERGNVRGILPSRADGLASRHPPASGDRL